MLQYTQFNGVFPAPPPSPFSFPFLLPLSSSPPRPFDSTNPVEPLPKSNQWIASTVNRIRIHLPHMYSARIQANAFRIIIGARPFGEQTHFVTHFIDSSRLSEMWCECARSPAKCAKKCDRTGDDRATKWAFNENRLCGWWKCSLI